ncbi:hypothetical protein CPC08DRAFT_479897 [Agrocybe pediades]|nr:hypothetical protein CPC08DRAFT_479897 [Agrocybe pediades]
MLHASFSSYDHSAVQLFFCLSFPSTLSRINLCVRRYLQSLTLHQLSSLEIEPPTSSSEWALCTSTCKKGLPTKDDLTGLSRPFSGYQRQYLWTHPAVR